MLVRFRTYAWRTVREHPRRSVLTVTGVAVGVALIVAMLCLGAMAVAGVRRDVAQRYGGADLMVGFTTPGRLLTADDLAFIRQTIPIAEMGEIYLPFMGQPFALETNTYYSGVSDSIINRTIFGMARVPGDGEVILSESFAARLGAVAGQTVSIPFPDGAQQWRVAAIIPVPARVGTPDVAFFHLQSLGRATGKEGVTYVYINLPDGTPKPVMAEQLQEELERRLGPEQRGQFRIDTLDEADEALRSVGGLRDIGIAIGLLSLLVSTLLVTSISQLALRDRLAEISLLRVLGASRWQVLRVLLRESFLLGLAGAVLGAALGLALSQAAAGLVAARFELSLVRTAVPWGGIIGMTALGLVMMMVASLVPAWQASSTPPAAVMRRADQDEFRPGRKPVLPILLLLAAGGMQYVIHAFPSTTGDREALLGVLSGLLVAITLFALGWILTWTLIRALRALRVPLGAGAQIALQNVLATQRTNRLTTGILGSAVALAVTAFTLIQSISVDADRQLHLQFPTEVVAVSQKSMATTLPLTIADAVGQIPGVRAVSAFGVAFTMRWLNQDDFNVAPVFRRQTTTALDPDIRLTILPADLAPLAQLNLAAPLTTPESVVITRELARNTGLKVGDPIRVQEPGRVHRTVTGQLDLRVGAIIDQPLAGASPNFILVDWKILGLIEGERQVWKLLVDVAPGAGQSVGQALDGLRGMYPELSWSTEQQVQAEYRALARNRYMMVGVAVAVVVGIGLLSTVNTLSATLMTRRREHATLRAAGLTGLQLGRLIQTEVLLSVIGAVITGSAAGLSFFFLFATALGGLLVRMPGLMIALVAAASLALSWGVAWWAARKMEHQSVRSLLAQE